MKKMLFAALAAAVSLPSVGSVPRPWTPVKVSDGKVSVWGRDYAFASNALPTGVTSLGRDLLAGEMRVVCADTNGQEIAWIRRGTFVQEAGERSATVCGWNESPAVAVDTVTRIDYDGMAEVSLVLVPGEKPAAARVGRIWLEIPLRPERVRYYQYYPIPGGWGSCANAGAVKGPKAWSFLPTVWLGDETAGLCWFCESERDFASADGNRVIEVLPGAHETVLRIRLADRPVVLPHTWTFGLEATPVKPFDRTWNRNHVLHAAAMGAGITIRRPEVWWTAQRAAPDGDIEGFLDGAAAAGAKTVVFHEDWIPIQNNPTSVRVDFRPVVEGCHRRGMKLLVYGGYELSPLDPAWGRHHGDWLAHGPEGRPVGFWYRAPAQRDYRSCLASGFAETWLERAKRMYVELGIDGYYLDGTICPWTCSNERHGCGWRGADGRLGCSYPILSVRKVMRELYEFVDARGGVINAHQSGYTCPATLAFAHAYWDGEQIATRREIDVRRTLDLDAFRAEFMGRNHGVPCEFLAYEKPGWSYEDALALTLIHDVLVRPCGLKAVHRLSPIWKALDAFGATEAEFLPYWENPVAVEPAAVKASAYRHADGRTLCVVSNLSPDDSVRARLRVPAGAKDAVTGETLPAEGGAVVVELPPFRARLVSCSESK